MSVQCIQGDATRPESWRAALGKERAHLLFTDPPYCLLTRRRKGGDKRDPKGKKNEGAEVRRFESVREYKKFTQAWLSLALEHLEPGAPLIIWTNLLGRAPIAEVAKAHDYHSQGEFIWAKRTRESNSGEELLRMVETALVFTRNATYEPAPDSPAIPWAAVSSPAEHAHPNHKPFEVLEPLLRTWSVPRERVIDCFAGSGSIPAAALRLQRHAAAIELLPEWASRVTARLAKEPVV
jgi:site-specific DNA-methyltransferase (adenine-specific)